MVSLTSTENAPIKEKMKYILILLTVLGLIECGDKAKGLLIGKNFKNFSDIDYLAEFEKVSDTICFNNETNPEHGLLHLISENNNLVVYSSIDYDSSLNQTRKVLDTLLLSNLNRDARLTINFCQINLKSQDNLSIIALVEITDSKDMYIKKVYKAWIANPDTEKIEPLNDVKSLDCFNEFYDGKEE